MESFEEGFMSLALLPQKNIFYLIACVVEIIVFGMDENTKNNFALENVKFSCKIFPNRYSLFLSNSSLTNKSAILFSSLGIFL